MPVAAVAVDVLRLQSDLRRIDLLALPLNGNGLPLERLRLETAAVTDVQRELGVSRDRRRQVDDDGVLPDDAEMQEPPQLRREYAANGERFGQPQRQRAERERSDANEHRGPAVDPEALRIERRFDVVVQNVVLDEVILAVPSSTCRQLLSRWVDGNVAPPLAVEEGDVLGVLAGTRIRQRSVLSGPNLRDQVAGRWRQRPAVAAQIGEIEVQRPADILVEHLRGPAHIAARDGTRRPASLC